MFIRFVDETLQSGTAIAVNGERQSGAVDLRLDNRIAVWFDARVRLKPLAHQRVALRKLTAHLRKHDRAQAHMACATGKTFIGAWTAERLQARKTLVLVPSLALIHQTFDAYTKAKTGKWQALTVCSDRTIQKHAEDLEEISCPSTSDPEEIKKFLRKQGQLVVFATYQSVVKLEGLGFDFGVFDEAHKTAGEKGKAFAYAIDNYNVPIKKRLFLTATPRRHKVSEYGTELLHDMNDEAMYGETAHTLSFRSAVEQGIICDYRVVISVVREMVDTDHHAAAQQAVLRAMRKYRLKKAFTYHTTVNDAVLFSSNAYGIFPDNYDIMHVSGYLPYKTRREVMERFEAADVAVLSNSRCLIEGVDVPAVDMVAFIQPKESVIDVVQATGRAMRWDQTGKKEIGYILIPVFLRANDNESVEEAVSRAKFSHVYEILQAMSDQDQALEAGVYHSYRVGQQVEFDFDIDIDEGEDVDIDSLRKAIRVRVLNNLMGAVSIKKKSLVKLAKSGAPRPANRSKDLETKTMGVALSNYTGRKTGNLYDPKFDLQMRQLRPDWFENTATKRKDMLLARAEAGKAKPTFKTEKKLAAMLRLYVTAGSKVYDPKFVAAIQATGCDWLQTTIYTKAKGKKTILLQMASENKTRPRISGRLVRGPERELGMAFRRYTTRTEDTYDKKFTKQVKKLAPAWFKHRIINR